MKSSRKNKSINRRELIRLAGTLGGLAALSSFLAACERAGLISPGASEVPVGQLNGTPAETPFPIQPSQPAVINPATEMPIQSSATSNSNMTSYSRVAFVKTNDRQEGVRRAIEILDINPVAGKSIFLKPNFNSSDPTPGSTHPDVITALVGELKNMGANRITVGDRSGMGDTNQVMRDLGIYELAEKLGFEILNFDDLGKEDWVMVTPSGSYWKNGFPFARACLEKSGAVVQTCCLKTHRYGGHFTLSLKNSVGMVASRVPSENYDYMNELHNSSHQRRMIAEINLAYMPALIVMDGVEAFISGGPDKGEKVHSQVVLAATDRVAIDAVGVALLRYHGCQTEVAKGKIFDQEQIARAVELGLGADSAGKIELLAPDQDSRAYAAQIYDILAKG